MEDAMQTSLFSRWDKMAFGLAIWLCTLPFAFAAFFFFGWQAGITVALGSFLAVTIFCWAWCGFHFWRSRHSHL
jgi:hypothetical protein